MNYLIPLSKVEIVDKKLNTIANKCNKYGCVFTMSKLGTKLVDNVLCMEYEVNGVAIINGFQFVASIEHTKNGNIIRNISGVELPEKYSTIEPYCEHCKTRHHRNNTYIVRNMATNELVQLGSSCVKLYTNGLDMEVIGYYENTIELLEEESDLEQYFSNGGEEYYETRNTINKLYSIIRVNGYNKNTIGELLNDFVGNANNDIDSFIGWVNKKAENGYNEYFNNVNVIVSMVAIKAKHINFIASAINSYFKEQLASANSSFYGNIGDRVTIEVASCKVLYKKSFSYGWNSHSVTNVYKVVDTNGNVFKMNFNKELSVGEKVKGTITNHTEYNGEKQTELSRVMLAA